MIIPDYWDEHKEKRKLSTRKQATITRFGWSDLNQDDAKRHAKQRVEEAFQKLEDGQEVERREKRVSYNGSEGVPIREEVVQFHGDAVVSRNIYGVLCINTPDVLFADIDFGENYQEEIGNFWAWVLMTGGFYNIFGFPRPQHKANFPSRVHRVRRLFPVKCDIFIFYSWIWIIWRGSLPHFWVLAALIQHNSGQAGRRGSRTWPLCAGYAR